MKKIISAICFLFLVGSVKAEVVTETLALLSATGGSATATGDIKATSTSKELLMKSFVCRATAANVSGSSPTLDLKIQTCRTTDTSTCFDLCVFPTCQTGSCWTTGAQAHFSQNAEAIYPYFRAIATFGGSSPVYTYSISIDY